MSNTIEACKQAGAALVFLDNVYMYGRVDGPMTEETPYNPCSRKGEVRARIARQLRGGDEERRGPRPASRGPPTSTVLTPTGTPFRTFSRSTGSWPARGPSGSSTRRSRIRWPSRSTPPAGWRCSASGRRRSGRSGIFRRPTRRSTGRPSSSSQRRRSASRPGSPPQAVDGPARRRLQLRHLRDGRDALPVREPYRFDSTKITRAFGISPTPYPEGIRETVAWLKGARRGGAGSPPA